MLLLHIPFEFNNVPVKKPPLTQCCREEGFRSNPWGLGQNWQQPRPHALLQRTPPPQAVLVGSPRDLSHLWGFFERFAVEAAYSSAFDKLIVSWRWLTGLPFELGTVAGLVDHLIIWGLVLGPGFYWFHRLDVCPCSEFIPVDQTEHRCCETSRARKQRCPHSAAPTALPPHSQCLWC